VPMNVTRYGDSFEKRIDPWGRDYYWLKGGPAGNHARPRNRSFGPGQGKGDPYAVGLQPDAQGRVGPNGAMAVPTAGDHVQRVKGVIPWNAKNVVRTLRCANPSLDFYCCVGIVLPFGCSRSEPVGQSIFLAARGQCAATGRLR